MSELRTDYHDYVFKDGKLLGKFEDMYRCSVNVPWHQDDVSRFPDIPLSKYILSLQQPYDGLLEIGCGLGYYLHEISGLAGGASPVCGIDLSPTAIEKARAGFPQYHFQAADITSPGYDFASIHPFPQPPELVVMRAVFWYIFEKLDQVVENINRSVRPGGYLFVHQNFPPLDTKFVGKEAIPGPEALIRLFAPGYSVVVRNDLDLAERRVNDYWLSVLLKKKSRD